MFLLSSRLPHVLFLVASLAWTFHARAATTSNVFNNVVSNINTYAVDGNPGGNPRVDVWNLSRFTVLTNETVGVVNTATLTLNTSANFVRSRLLVGQNRFSEGTVLLNANSLLGFENGATNSPLILGWSGTARMIASNSTIRAFSVMLCASYDSRADLILVGSTNVVIDDPGLNAHDVSVASAPGTIATVTLSGRSVLDMHTNSILFIGNGGLGTLTVSNSLVRAPQILVGVDFDSVGRLNLVEATNRVFATATQPGRFTVGADFSENYTGIVSAVSGSLIEGEGAAEMDVGGLFGCGKLTASNSTFRGFNLTVGTLIGAIGEMTLVASTNITTGSVVLCADIETTGTVSLTQSSLLVATNNTRTGSIRIGFPDYSSSKPILNATNSTLVADSIRVGIYGSLLLAGSNQITGVVTNRGTLRSTTGLQNFNGDLVLGSGCVTTITNSTWQINGNLQLVTNATLTVPLNGTVRLAGSFSNNTSSNRFNFGGSLVFNGGGSNQFFEVRGINRGVSLANYTNNFGISSLQVGPTPALATLTGGSSNALYAAQAVVSISSTLDLNGIPLFTSNVVNNGPLVLNGATLSAIAAFTNNGTLWLRGPNNTNASLSAIVQGRMVNNGTTIVERGTLTFTSNVVNNGLIVATNFGTVIFQRPVTGTGTVLTNFPPVANFTGSPQSGVVPLSVTFTDTSTGTITNRFWNFGDGATTNTTSTNLVHLYAQPGTNTVTLIASGFVGASTNVRAAYIIVTNIPPILTVTPSSRSFGSVLVGQTNSETFQIVNAGQLTLTGTATVASPFVIASGSPYVVPGGQTSVVAVSFIPIAPGSFSNSVVFTSNGGNATNVVSGTGFTPPQIGINPTNLNFGPAQTGTMVQASFVVTNLGTAVMTGTATVNGVTFSLLSGSPFTVDGWSSTNVVIGFTPPAEGDFSGSVEFLSNGGNSTNTIEGVGAIFPQAGFSNAPTNGAVPLLVSFTDTSTGTITNRRWSFGDGIITNTTSTSVQHTYTGPGTNTVTLIVSGPLGSSTDTRANGIVVTNIPPILRVLPATRNYGTLVLGQTNTLPFQVINDGQLTLTGTATVASPFTILSGAPYAVPGGGTNVLAVSFIPVASGSFSNSVILSSNGGNATNRATGAAVTPAKLEVLPASLEFGPILTGSLAQATFVVTNTGGATLSGSATVTGSVFAIAEGSAFFAVGYGSANVRVTFQPPSEGLFSNSVAFISNGGASTNPVRGTGATPPVASFTGAPTSGLAPLTVTFSDASTGTITNRNWSFGDGATTNLLSTSVVHTFPLAGTNTVRLIVSGPLGASTNTRTNYIVVTNKPPKLNVSPSSRDFGAVTIGQTNSLVFQIINSGELTLTGTATVAGPFAISSGGPYVVAGAQTGTVSVSFIPVAAGPVTNAVLFTSNGGASTNTVTGLGLTPPMIGVSPSTLNFGIRETGSVSQLSLVVTNAGGSVLTGTAAVAGGPYTILSGSPYTVAGFGSTNLVVRFVPVSEGTFSNSVFFTSNGGNPTNDLTGIGAIVPQANFSGAPTSGLAPLSVTFVDTSLGTITNRNWSFGDGSSTNTTSTNLLHSYLVAGTNTVRLIASGPLGASTNLRPAYIVVTNRPPQLFVTPSGRDFGVLTVGQTSSLPFQVINLGEVTLAGTATATGPFLVSGGSPYSVLGGQTGTVTVSFLPLTEGSFSNAVVFQSNGGASTNHLQGTAFFPPVANFLADPTNGAAPLLVTFTDQSTGVVTNRVWMFGDGTSTSTASSVTTHLYTLHRTNTVSLIAEGPGGASTNTKPDYIVVVVYPPGDLNGDFHVRGADSLLINQVLVGLRPTNSPIFAVTRYQNGDVNQDGAVAGQDSLLINQVVVDLRSYLVTKILPDSRSGSTPTPVTIYGVGFPTGTVSAVTIGPPVNLTLSNVVVVSEERIEAIVPMGGGLGTGTVTVIATPTNGVISFGRFINE